MEEKQLRYKKDSHSNELWYDENDKVIHIKHPGGVELWFDQNGETIRTEHNPVTK